MQAEIVSIGNELLNGRKVNSNASFMAASLAAIGIGVERVTACSDNIEVICCVLEEALSRSKYVLVTGGLGPTGDDRTKKAVMKLLRKGLRFDVGAYDNLVTRMQRFGRELSPSMHDQVMVIEGSTVIPNTKGTAAGMIIGCGASFSNHTLVLMPGVPSEMKAMMELTVVPFLARLSSSVIVHTQLRTAGLGESTLSELIREIEETLPEGTELAYLPHSTGVDLMVSTRGSAREPVEHENRDVADAIVQRAERFIYTKGEKSFEETIGEMLISAGKTVAVAESCTGGLVASRLTDVPGSSGYFLQGFVVYSNSAKESVLGVPGELIEKFGAVSEETARAMALGCLEKSGADLAVSTTGIAGPAGGSSGKPVGMLCLALAEKGTGVVESKTLFMHGDRALNKLRFSEAALLELWERLKHREP
ncbi:MAG: CinA family nicotinamide mononucleotide deamidase-related protein [Chlorobiaceae bacterium]|nr:CinA family nicotinamide mononucleotide deamidase-related protein [Chlorobiaceae bacterium]NTW10932.1 CinA family nicotinamide mononucleotide deamidase-related protein [Chlorobiaceae bacterium]